MRRERQDTGNSGGEWAGELPGVRCPGTDSCALSGVGLQCQHHLNDREFLLSEQRGQSGGGRKLSRHRAGRLFGSQAGAQPMLPGTTFWSRRHTPIRRCFRWCRSRRTCRHRSRKLPGCGLTDARTHPLSDHQSRRELRRVRARPHPVLCAGVQHHRRRPCGLYGHGPAIHDPNRVAHVGKYRPGCVPIAVTPCSMRAATITAWSRQASKRLLPRAVTMSKVTLRFR